MNEGRLDVLLGAVAERRGYSTSPRRVRPDPALRSPAIDKGKGRKCGEIDGSLPLRDNPKTAGCQIPCYGMHAISAVRCTQQRWRL